MRPAQSSYFLPRHPTEVDRLDVQHFAIRMQLKGNFLAPIQSPARILDVGCGSGQWAFELATDFPEATVIGLDLEPSKKDSPANYRFVRGNVLHGLPFEDGTFDFVHQRLLIAGIPVRNWPAVVAELVRVTRPRGWIELMEAESIVKPEGPATRAVYEVLRPLGRQAGLDSLGYVHDHLERYLVRAGAEATRSRIVEMPIGEWGGEVGAWMLWDYRALFTRLVDVIALGTEGDVDASSKMIATMLSEIEEVHGSISFRAAYGRRPASRRGGRTSATRWTPWRA